MNALFLLKNFHRCLLNNIVTENRLKLILKMIFFVSEQLIDLHSYTIIRTRQIPQIEGREMALRWIVPRIKSRYD